MELDGGGHGGAPVMFPSSLGALGEGFLGQRREGEVGFIWVQMGALISALKARIEEEGAGWHLPRTGAKFRDGDDDRQVGSDCQREGRERGC